MDASAQRRPKFLFIEILNVSASSHKQVPQSQFTGSSDPKVRVADA